MCQRYCKKVFVVLYLQINSLQFNPLRMRILYAILLILCGYHTFACSCIGKGKFDMQFKESDVVFSGKVIRLDTVSYSDTTPVYVVENVKYSVHHYARIKAVFQIEERFKGLNKGCNFVVVFTEVESNMCGFLFEVDKDYVVYCKIQYKLFRQEPKRKKFLYTDKCRRTQWSTPEELTLLHNR